MTQPPPAPAPPPRFRLLLDEAVRQVRLHFWTIFVPVGVPLALLSGVIPVLQATWMSRLMRNPDPGAGAMAEFGVFLVIILALAFLMMGLYLVGYTAMMTAAVDASAGRPVSMARAWAFAVRPPVFLTMLLAGIAAAAGMMCCCLPGVYVAIILSVLVPVMVEENLSGTDAMGRSLALTSHNPSGDLSQDPRLRALVILVAAFILSYALSLIAQLPFAVAQQVMFFRAVGRGSTPDPAEVFDATMWLQVPAQVLGTLAQIAVQLFMSFALAFFYFELRRRKEGGDLQSAIDRLAGPPTGPAPA